MKIFNGFTIAGLMLAALMLGSNESMGQACDHGGNHTIQVQPGPDGTPELSYRGGSAENVHVCVGDQVQWVLTGSDRQFFVDFMSGAPFPGDQKRGSASGVIAVEITGEAGNYLYGVNFAGVEGIDPEIIVD